MRIALKKGEFMKRVLLLGILVALGSLNINAMEPEYEDFYSSGRNYFPVFTRGANGYLQQVEPAKQLPSMYEAVEQAIRTNDDSSLRQLLKSGANPNAYIPDIRSEQEYASSPRPWHPLIIQVLGAQKSAEQIKNIVSLLLQLEANINIQDKNDENNTPLSALTEKGEKCLFFIDILEFLLSNGANPNIRNNKDKTTLDILSGIKMFHTSETGQQAEQILRKYGAKTGAEIDKELNKTLYNTPEIEEGYIGKIPHELREEVRKYTR
jgi:hypothetical protein